ncbi:MAG: OmpA family protein [Rikenellaceae bacterium]
MKKVILSVVVLLMSMTSTMTFAQSSSSTESSGVILDSNSISQNWFISGGIGGSVYFGDGDALGSFGGRIAPAFDLAVGKWFSPYVGARLEYSGARLKGYTNNANGMFVYETVESGVYHDKWNYMFLHVDAMLDLLNLISGYNADRFYSLIPYAGGGWLRDYGREDKVNNDAFGINLGLLNSFQLSPKFDLNLDVRGTIVGSDDFDGQVGGRGMEGILNATVGVTYKFGTQGWEAATPASVVAGYIATIKDNESTIEKQKAQLAAAQKKNQEIEKELAAKEASVTKALQAARESGANVTMPSVVIAFEIGSSKLSNLGKANLENIAKVMKKAPASKKFKVTGYADTNTGSAKRNAQLSQERANVVADYLVECGVSRSMLNLNSETVGTMYLNDITLSRVAVVE